MRIHRLQDRELTRFDSAGIMITPVARGRGASSLNLIRIATGGTIGAHLAVGPQLLVPVSGRIRVSGRDHEPTEIGPGEAVTWESGEIHQTWAEEDSVVLVFEPHDGVEVAKLD